VRACSNRSGSRLARVWPEPEFTAQAGLEAALGFAALAILLTFLILNLNHLFWIKDALQAWLCAYLASLVWVYTAVLGFSAQFIIPDHPEWNGLWMGLGNMVMMTTSSGFLRHLFGRRGYWFYLIGGWLPALGVIGVLLGYYPEIMPIFFAFYLILTVVGLGLSVGLLRRAETGALLTFFAIFSGLVGILIMILNLEGLLLGGLTLLYSMMGCTILQVGLLHLAVGSKYQKLEVERIHAAHKAVRAEEEACREREARVEQSELFAMISHEIKTPLTMINGAVQSLEALVLGSPDINRRHERIRRAVWRIDSLVEKALEYDLSESQMSDAGANLIFDVGPMIDRVLRQYDLPEGRIRLRVDPRPCRVRGQARLIEILLGNLIDNALKYGSETPIEILVSTSGRDARIDIRDWGLGVTPELIPHLFERYRRGSDHGNITGAGLGLYLVARIARWHGGDVRYVEPENGGACFRVRLPMAHSADESRE
jgi:signal transduction histidine kinase